MVRLVVTRVVYGTLLAATLVRNADAKCNCAAGTGNTWVTDRACGDWGTDTVLRDAIYPKVDQDCVDGADAASTPECPRVCQMRHDDERNKCPESSPVEEYSGFVWCNCMDPHSRVIKSATQAECLRTEGLTTEQAAAYSAAGINLIDYVCQCCSCQATLNGVPKVGEPGKTCDNGNLDPDSRNSECANTFIAYLGLLVFLSFCTGLGIFLNKKHEADLAQKPKGSVSDDG
jgi:hypothetical protein